MAGKSQIFHKRTPEKSRRAEKDGLQPQDPAPWVRRVWEVYFHQAAENHQLRKRFQYFFH